MSEAKFTRGEWKLVTEPISEHYLITVDCGGIMEIMVITSATDITFTESVEREANAHLIAAAPEMYELLEDILFNEDLSDISYLKARNLLAKARGEKHD